MIDVERFPFGKQFALSLVDDTDGAKAETIGPVYKLLSDHEIRCTKTVWPFRTSAPSGYEDLRFVGDTLQDKPNRGLCESLHDAGFEIAMHTASAGDSKRDETIAAYEFFESIFGHSPATNVMHGRNRENIYWGRHSLPNGVWKSLIAQVEPLDFAGHQPSSEYYWGDVCREKTRYVRQFETLSVNTIRFDKATPYHDPDKPDVAWWFSASYAGVPGRLFALLTDKNIAHLAEERGASIVHTYLKKFAGRDQEGDPVDSSFRSLIGRLAKREDGWYVPVATLLDRLRATRALRLRSEGNTIWIHNTSDVRLDDLALRMPKGLVTRITSTGREPLRNAIGQVHLGSLKPGELLGVMTASPRHRILKPSSRSPDYNRLALGYARRIIWQFMHGRRHMLSWK